jgi:hypothetical protein
VPGVLGQDTTQMPLAEDQHMVQALAARCPREPFGECVRLRDRTGVLITLVPFPDKTSSNVSVNFPVRR